MKKGLKEQLCGLNNEAVEQLVKDGVDLLITVDCGISNNQEVDLLKKNSPRNFRRNRGQKIV